MVLKGRLIHEKIRLQCHANAAPFPPNVVSCATRDQLVYSYSHGLYPAPFIGETIGQRLDWATENFPDREAYVCCEDKTRATFAEFREEVLVHKNRKWFINLIYLRFY